MLFNKRIVVILGGTASDDRALERASLIARKMRCSLDVYWLSDPVNEPGLSQFVARLEADGIPMQSHYVHGKDLLDALLGAWQKDHFSLVVKSCKVDHKGVLLPLDWKLLRRMPCPVLLVKQESRWAGGRVLAVLDPRADQEDATHRRSLNQTVGMLGGLIAKEAEADLLVTCCYPPPMLGAEKEQQSGKKMAENAMVFLQSFTQSWHLQPKECLVGEGPAELWISQTAQSTQANVVVMGTKARKGLRGWLLGNVAEQLMDHLHADLLVVREGMPSGLAESISTDVTS
jgi:universal stress protein E